MAPNIPKTLPRSCAGKVTWMIASTCGTIIAAIAPWSSRDPTSISALTAKPHRAEAIVKPVIPIRKSRFRP